MDFIGGASIGDGIVITEDQKLRNTLSWIMTDNPRQYGLNVQEGEWIWVDELASLPHSLYVKSRKYSGAGRDQYTQADILKCLQDQKKRYELDCINGRHRVRRLKDARAEARHIAEQKKLALLKDESGSGTGTGSQSKKPKQVFRPRMTHRVENGVVKQPPKRTEEEKRIRALKVYKAKRLLKNMGIDPYKLKLDLEETELDITFVPFEDYHREQYGHGMIKGKKDDYEASFEEIDDDE